MSRLMGRNPGALFDRVTIEAEQLVDDGRGGKISQGWAAISGGTDLPAEVRPLEGHERLRAMQAQADVTHEVTMRYVEGVKAAHRLKVTSDGDRILHLVAPPVVVGRKQWLRLLCSEAVDA